jgi:hypothetical protein
MPQRSNDFQHLVYLIQKALAPKDAIVVESAIVEHAGGTREIDVLVNANIGMYRMKIAVEARDHKRKLDVTDVEMYIGKYRSPDGIPVNQIVLVSRKGFTEAAKARARAVGMKVFTLDEAHRQNWLNFIPANRKHPFVFRVAPHLAIVRIEPLIAGVDKRRVMTEGKIRCLGCGKVNGSVMWYAEHNLQCHLPTSVKAQLEDAVQKATTRKEDGRFCFRVAWKPQNKVLVLDGNEYPVTKVTAHIHDEKQRGELDFKCYDLIDEDDTRRVIQYGKGIVGRKEISIILPDGTSSPQITLDIREICEESKSRKTG